MRTWLLAALACAALVAGTLVRLAPARPPDRPIAMTAFEPAGGAGFEIEPAPAPVAVDFAAADSSGPADVAMADTPVLLGITGGRRKLSHLSVDGRMITLAAGEAVSGWRVTVIETDAVIIENADGTRRLRLYADRPPSGETEGR